jgi:hypothetical protein
VNSIDRRNTSFCEEEVFHEGLPASIGA